MEWIDHLLIVIFGFALPVRSLLTTSKGELLKMKFTAQNKFILYYSNSLVLWFMATAVMFAWFSFGRELGELGLQWGDIPFSPAAWLTLLAFILLYGLDSMLEVISPERQAATRQKFQQQIGFLPANAFEFTHFVFLAVTAGVCEEIVFRGYFIRYGEWWLSELESPLATILVLVLPAVSFGLAHLYQGWWAVAKIVAMAVLFGFFFLETGTLWPLILVHIVVDLIGGLVSWYLLSGTAPNR